jgi:hypothetical protein
MSPLAPERRAFVVQLRAEPGIDGIKALRALLKFAGRRLGLRAIDVRELQDERNSEPAFVSPSPRSHPTRETKMSAFSDRVQAQREEQKETGLFKVEHLKPNKELLLTINRLDEEVEMFNKKVDLLNFVERGQQLQLNLTTSQWLIDNLGSNPEDWPGKQVVLHLAPYKFEGETKMGIRLKLPGSKPAAKEGTIIAPRRGDGTARAADDMDDGIPF